MLDALVAAAAQAGLTVRGAFRPGTGDGAPSGTSTIVLLGWGGGRHWARFQDSAEANDGWPDALDRWSRRVIGTLAREVGATALYPFDGPPHHPFQRWAMRAEPVFRSPLGLLIHPEYGLWHSYRGALAFHEAHPLPGRVEAPHPCESCADKPCLSACPVGAFRPEAYDVTACRAHVRGPTGADCAAGGCLARRACPAGREHAYGPDEQAFYMAAFSRSSSR